MTMIFQRLDLLLSDLGHIVEEEYFEVRQQHTYDLGI